MARWTFCSGSNPAAPAVYPSAPRKTIAASGAGTASPRWWKRRPKPAAPLLMSARTVSGGLRLDQPRQIADIGQLADFAGGELHAERFLHGRDEAQMAQAVPFIDIIGGQFRPGDQGLVVKHLAQDGGEPWIDGVGVHGVSRAGPNCAFSSIRPAGVSRKIQ